MTLQDFANILIFTAGIGWSVELIPQILKTRKLKTVHGISPYYFCISWFSYVIYILGNIITKNWVIVISHIPGVLATTIMIIFFFKYKDK